MRYRALACDYDGTLAHDGRVDDAAVAALRRVRDAGKRLLLVTGRRLGELAQVFPHLDLFDRVIAENGALLYTPETRRERALAPPPPRALLDRIRQANVTPLAVGRAIVATRQPHEVDLLAAIRDLGLEWELIFNKGAVMALPAGITKGSGLAAALAELRLSAHNVAAIGDAENDHPLLRTVECGVAVANAVPALKDQADWVTRADHGAGVVELIDKLLASDLAEIAARLRRHAIPIGRVGAVERRIDAYGPNVLVADNPDSGKSSLAAALIEQLAQRRYQYCVVDPEGDYAALDAVVFGTADQPPPLDEAIDLLDDPQQSIVLNLIAVPVADRPRLFARAISALLDLRARSGRPHWLIVDACHHLLPASAAVPKALARRAMRSVVWITVHPDHVARAVLERCNATAAFGEAAPRVLRGLSAAHGLASPDIDGHALRRGEAWWWAWHEGAPERLVPIAPRRERRRRQREYAHGELGGEESFYFRGPEQKLNLRAQNLELFMQAAEGVDEATWLYHLRRGDYSRWFRRVVKDATLADAAEAIERMSNAPARETRRLLRAQIETRYTAPA